MADSYLATANPNAPWKLIVYMRYPEANYRHCFSYQFASQSTAQVVGNWIAARDPEAIDFLVIQDG